MQGRQPRANNGYGENYESPSMPVLPENDASQNQYEANSIAAQMLIRQRQPE